MFEFFFFVYYVLHLNLELWDNDNLSTDQTA